MLLQVSPLLLQVSPLLLQVSPLLPSKVPLASQQGPRCFPARSPLLPSEVPVASQQGPRCFPARSPAGAGRAGGRARGTLGGGRGACFPPPSPGRGACWEAPSSLLPPPGAGHAGRRARGMLGWRRARALITIQTRPGQEHSPRSEITTDHAPLAGCIFRRSCVFATPPQHTHIVPRQQEILFPPLPNGDPNAPCWEAGAGHA